MVVVVVVMVTMAVLVVVVVVWWSYNDQKVVDLGDGSSGGGASSWSSVSGDSGRYMTKKLWIKVIPAVANVGSLLKGIGALKTSLRSASCNIYQHK